MGNLLGYQARAAVASRLIPKITKPSGTITTDSTSLIITLTYTNLKLTHSPGKAPIPLSC